MSQRASSIHQMASRVSQGIVCQPGRGLLYRPKGLLCWSEGQGASYVGGGWGGGSYFCQRTSCIDHVASCGERASHIGRSASNIDHRAFFVGKRISHICQRASL